MHETFFTLLCDRAHWEFEIFLMILFDGFIFGTLYPIVSKHVKHHLARDARESASPAAASPSTEPVADQPDWAMLRAKYSDEPIEFVPELSKKIIDSELRRTGEIDSATWTNICDLARGIVNYWTAGGVVDIKFREEIDSALAVLMLRDRYATAPSTWAWKNLVYRTILKSH